MTGVRYVTVTSAHLDTGGPAAVLLRHSHIECAVDLAQIRDPLIPLLTSCTAAQLNMVHLRNVPTVKPWGTVRYIRRDIPVPRRLPFRFTRSGLFIDLPQSLITMVLANYLSCLGTDLMRWFDPPPMERMWRTWR